MLVIQNAIVSEDVLSEQFVCNLSACKGECCVAGDVGAPLERGERQILENIYQHVKPFLLQEGIQAIEDQGKWVETEEPEKFNTPLMPGGGCAWMYYGEGGVVSCAIEKAWQKGLIDFKKPISCHLYPIRITRQKKYGMDMLNYERWSICKAACSNGLKLKTPVYRFLKEPIIRKYGQEFYQAMEEYQNARG